MCNEEHGTSSSHLAYDRIYRACRCKNTSSTPRSARHLPHPIRNDTMGSSFSFFTLFLILSSSLYLHSSLSCFFLSLYLCFSCSLRIAGLLRRAAESWDSPWLKLPVNDKGPNAAAHALILICMHPQQHIFPPFAHSSDTDTDKRKRRGSHFGTAAWSFV